jgi:rRNA-processing protein FCF1
VFRGKWVQLGVISKQKAPLKVILDSNALFVPFQFKIDIIFELNNLLERRYELILLSAVRQELRALASKGSPKMRKTASCALILAGKCRQVELKIPESTLVDDAIIEAARDFGAMVFTNDRQLRKRLRDISVPVIYLRQKSRLAIDGLV